MLKEMVFEYLNAFCPSLAGHNDSIRENLSLSWHLMRCRLEQRSTGYASSTLTQNLNLRCLYGPTFFPYISMARYWYLDLAYTCMNPS